MSSPDLYRISESAEDSALREELRQLLGAPADDLFEVQPTPEMIALAEDLRREAARRRRTAIRPHSRSWMLLAAALPLAVALVGIFSWGMQQKHRADAMASMVAEKEQALQLANIQVRQQQTLLLASAAESSQPKNAKASSARPAELVIPAERTALPSQADVKSVKAH